MEPQRPRAPGIHKEDAGAHHLMGLVSVPAHNNLEPGGKGVKIKLLEVMQYIEGCAVRLTDLCEGQLQGPFALVPRYLARPPRGPGPSGGRESRVSPHLPHE